MCCTKYYTPNTSNNYTVTSTQTWDASALTTLFGTTQPLFNGTLTVNAGVTLTLENVTLRFHPDARIVIQPGARLNVNGSTLTGLSCGLMWKGVRVVGDIPPKRGTVTPTTAENAKDREYQFWERNAYSVDLYSESFYMQKFNYLHNNPVQKKWKLAELPEEYRWSSAGFYYKGEDAFGFISHYRDE